LLSAVVVFASTCVLTKQALREFLPLAFAFVRFAGITALAFLVLAASVRAGRASWGIYRGDLARFGLLYLGDGVVGGRATS